MVAIGTMVLAEARTWIGTPYLHQASCKGAGADCLGLLRGVWRAVLGEEPVHIPPYSQDWSEPQGTETLWQAAKVHLNSKHKDDEAPGDVLLFRMRDGSVAKHLGLASSVGMEARFIHSYSGHGVVESPLTKPWRRRIAARFAFPERT